MQLLSCAKHHHPAASYQLLHISDTTINNLPPSVWFSVCVCVCVHFVSEWTCMFCEVWVHVRAQVYLCMFVNVSAVPIHGVASEISLSIKDKKSQPGQRWIRRASWSRPRKTHSASTTAACAQQCTGAHPVIFNNPPVTYTNACEFSVPSGRENNPFVFSSGL